MEKVKLSRSSIRHVPRYDYNYYVLLFDLLFIRGSHSRQGQAVYTGVGYVIYATPLDGPIGFILSEEERLLSQHGSRARSPMFFRVSSALSLSPLTAARGLRLNLTAVPRFRRDTFYSP